MTTRPRSILLLGATGYTGERSAEYIVRNLPSDLSWAIAGRSLGKLGALGEYLRTINPHRKAPEVIETHLEQSQLDTLAAETTVVINTVGPYELYSEPVVRACAYTGTYYVDATGEVDWVKEMIGKYDDVAKKNNTILISSAGVDSAAPDIFSYVIAKAMKEQYNVAPLSIVDSIHDLKAAPSGGTLSSLLNKLSKLTLREVITPPNLYALAVTPPTGLRAVKPLTQRLLGSHHDPDLGPVVTTPSELCDAAIVHRTASLLPDLYGRATPGPDKPVFTYSEYAAVSFVLVGAAVNAGLLCLFGLLAFVPPARSLLASLIYRPGSGPSRTDSADDRLELHAVARSTVPKQNGQSEPVKLKASFVYEGSLYDMTAMFLGEAARLLSNVGRGLDEKRAVEALPIRSGYLTPAMLGDEFVDRVQRTGGIIIKTGIEF